MNYQHKGFTLIEMALVVLIIGILASMALPTYRDNTEKARLVELLLQVDAMRTAMTSAYESGDRSMLSLKVSKLDTIKDQIPNVPLPDNFTYPPFEMLMLSTSQQFGPFGGTPRPYLVINAKDVDAVRTLHNFSLIYPQDRQAWWAPSTVMVIPLLDDAILGITRSSMPTNAGALPGSSSSTSSSLTSSSSTSSSSTSSSSMGSGTASSQGTGGASSTAVASPGSSTGSNSAASSSSSGTSSPSVTPPCVHPGNGHAYGRCRNH